MAKVNLKKVSKILLLLLVSVLVLVVLATIGSRTIYYTDGKIKKIATQTLCQKLHRQIEIDSLEVSIFSGVELKGLQVYDRADCGGELFLHLKSLKLKYRLLSLLKRQLEIQTIVIDQPEIFVRQLSDTLWNFSDLVQPKQREQPAASERAKLELPFLLVLRKLELKGASVQLWGPGELKLSGINLDIESLFFRSPQDFSLKTDLQISPPDDKNLSVASVLTAPELKVSSNLRFTLSGEISSEAPSTGEMDFDLENLEIYSGRAFPALSLSAGWKYAYDLNLDSLRLDEIFLELNENRLLEAEATLTSLTGQIQFRFASKSNRLKLGNFSQLVREFFPALQIEGESYWENVWATGNQEKIDAGLTFGLKNVCAQDSITGLAIDGLGFQAKLEAAVAPLSPAVEVKLDGDFSLQKVGYPLDDSLAITVAGISGQFGVELDSLQRGIPRVKSATFQAAVNEIFGGTASLFATLKSPQVGMSGSASVKQIRFDQLPRSPIIGSGSLELDFSAADFDDIACAYQLSTDSLKYQLEGDSIVSEPLQFSGKANLSVEEDLSRMELVHLDLTSAGLLDLSAFGGIYGFGQDSLQASLEAKIKHNRLPDFLPLELNRSLGGLQFAGETEIKAILRGQLPASGRPQIELNTILELTDFGMMLPAFETELRGLGGVAQVGFAADRVELQGLFRLDWIGNHKYLPTPISDCFLSLKASVTNLFRGDKPAPAERSLFLENFQFDCLSHKFGLVLNGMVSDLNTSPKLRLVGSFDFRSAEKITLFGEMKAQGGLSLRTNLSMRDSLVSLYGSADFQYLNLELPPLVSIENMNGHIPFHQKLDLKDISLIQDTTEVSAIQASSPFNYERLRPYNLQRGENISNFKIDKITAMRFSAENLEMDVTFGNSALHIPRLVGNLYDGNLYGNLLLDLKSLKLGGRKLDLEEVEYRASLQFSSVNFSEMTGLGEKIITAEKSLTGDIYLRGRGLVPAGDLEAELDITQVSAEVLSRIFDFLDPEGTDPSFEMTKTFLDQRFKVIGIIPIRFRPRWFSCGVRHGNIYPSLHADVYAPVPLIKQLIRLPMPIRYDRIPLFVILSQVGAEKEKESY